MLMRYFSYARVCVKVTVTNLEFDDKGETDEEEWLQVESEHDGTAEQEEQVPNITSKIRFLRDTKRP